MSCAVLLHLKMVIITKFAVSFMNIFDEESNFKERLKQLFFWSLYFWVVSRIVCLVQNTPLYVTADSLKFDDEMKFIL